MAISLTFIHRRTDINVIFWFSLPLPPSFLHVGVVIFLISRIAACERLGMEFPSTKAAEGDNYTSSLIISFWAFGVAIQMNHREGYRQSMSSCVC